MIVKYIFLGNANHSSVTTWLMVKSKSTSKKWARLRQNMVLDAMHVLNSSSNELFPFPSENFALCLMKYHECQQKDRYPNPRALRFTPLIRQQVRQQLGVDDLGPVTLMHAAIPQRQSHQRAGEQGPEQVRAKQMKSVNHCADP